MPILILYLATLVPFVALDVVMLTFVMGPLFKATVPQLLTASPRLLPAALFYLGYPAGILALITAPALHAGGSVLVPAAILGAMAYGTYELTSWSIMTGWTPAMAAADIGWGTVLTAVSAGAGLAIARALAA